MNKIARLLCTDSYFQIFRILKERLKQEKQNKRDVDAIIFCEEKISLFAERSVIEAVGGSFGTRVYSFGKYVDKHVSGKNVLSKEGSAMVIRRILDDCDLKCFPRHKINLAPTIFNLIMQLKSAKITIDDVRYASENCEGILQNKLRDVAEIYDKYDKFLSDGGLCDQSEMLSVLPEILKNDDRLKNSDVYLLGYSSWTGQIRSAVKTLLGVAKSVTAILTTGSNEYVYLNETADAFRKICKEAKTPLSEEFFDSDFSVAGKIIAKNVFNPFSDCAIKREIGSKKVFVTPEPNKYREIERVGQTIREAVANGRGRYSDFSVATDDPDGYADVIETIFRDLDIPYFLDVKKKPLSHPIVRLVADYLDALSRNFDSVPFIAFATNPLVSSDKSLNDEFIEYLTTHNVNYGRIKKPFATDGSEKSERLESHRKYLLSLFEKPNVKGLLEKVGAKEKTEALEKRLSDDGEKEESAFSAQVYDKVISLLDEQDKIIAGGKISYAERKTSFLSGISAMEISVIPQRNDGVFIGGYRETALARTDYLFAVGLTSAVPQTKDDIALLSDDDMDRLSEIKIMVEPKIRLVNRRAKENFALALASFGKALFASYPMTDSDGKNNDESEAISEIRKLFNAKALAFSDEYLTVKQGMKSFAKDCGKFINGKKDDVYLATCFYYTAKNFTDEAEKIIENANGEIVTRINADGRPLIGGETSPTTIEQFYKCPYRAFCEKILRLKPQEKGEVDPVSVGTLIHDILKEYVQRAFIDKTFKVEDKETSDELYYQCEKKVLSSEEYARFLANAETADVMAQIGEEGKKHCYACFKQISSSDFKPWKTEASFGKQGSFFPAVSLSAGQLKLVGKIDRIDENDGYVRIIDYKTGGKESVEKGLFGGTKLQLMLYALAVKDKKLAGAHYLKLSDAYSKKGAENKSEEFIGKTLGDDKIVKKMDNTFNGTKCEFINVSVKRDGSAGGTLTEEEMRDYVEYARLMSEQASRQMREGVVLPSPLGTCDDCPYLGLCSGNSDGRKIGTVKKETITEAVRSAEEKEEKGETGYGYAE